MKHWLRKLMSIWLLAAYHRCLALLAALWYGHPSRRLVVVGVTGTNGKSTTVNLIPVPVCVGGCV